MITFSIALVLVEFIYFVSKYSYIYLSKKLKNIDMTKNNYIVRNVLLSSKHESIDVFDIIVVLVITLFIFYT